jgi:hypothetical protein
LEAYFTTELATPEKHRAKILIVGKTGVGKTRWAATAPDVGIAACETGVGNGSLTLAHIEGVLKADPQNFLDFRSICLDTFEPFRKKQSIALDSLTYMTKSFVKDHCLANYPPRNQKEAMRRQAGVPTGFDWADISDTTRTLLDKLLHQNKHIIVTALEKIEKDENGAPLFIGPDLPGQLFLGAPAMFDTVLYLKTRKILKDPRDPKSVYIQRYFVTGNDGLHVGKDRNSSGAKSFLDPEEIFDLETGQGTFPYLYAKILAGHKASQEKSKGGHN